MEAHHQICTACFAQHHNWEPCLEPKHKIFLSHTGAQKDFAEELCKDLERVDHFPFFDKRPDSLRKGESFPPLIIKSAKECHAAILILSDIRVLGSHGTGGSGKTTITRAICNQMYGDFLGKVCHIELESKNIEVQRKVLRELTEASREILMKEAGKLGAFLKSRMKQHSF